MSDRQERGVDRYFRGQAMKTAGRVVVAGSILTAQLLAIVAILESNADAAEELLQEMTYTIGPADVNLLDIQLVLLLIWTAAPLLIGMAEHTREVEE